MTPAAALYSVTDALKARDQKRDRLLAARLGGLESHIREAQVNFDAADEQFVYALTQALEAEASQAMAGASHPREEPQT